MVTGTKFRVWTNIQNSWWLGVVCSFGLRQLVCQRSLRHRRSTRKSGMGWVCQVGSIGLLAGILANTAAIAKAPLKCVKDRTLSLADYERLDSGVSEITKNHLANPIFKRIPKDLTIENIKGSYYVKNFALVHYLPTERSSSPFALKFSAKVMSPCLVKDDVGLLWAAINEGSEIYYILRADLWSDTEWHQIQPVY